MVKIICIFILTTLPLFATAQLLEFHSVRKLPAAVNSTGEESLPLLSPDGRQLFFTRALYAGNAGGKFSGLDVWYSDVSGDTWKNSSNTLPGDINNDGHNAIIGISQDGNTRYFMSASPNEKMNGIYAAKRINNYWSRPQFVPVPGIDNQGFLGVYITPDAEVMLFSMKAPDSNGEEDLYFSVRSSSGQWSVPRNMGSTINTKGFEISPFLSADKKRLYFASNGHAGEGDADIFYSERLYNSWETWSLPVNLGKEVNSKKFDAYFSLYGDSVAYFASNRDGKFADIYAVKAMHGRSILSGNQRYVSRAEWNRKLGGAVSNEIVFASRNTALNASQQELLFYIANKLQLEKDILFHVIVKEEESPRFTTSRLNAVVKELVQSGIGEERIIVEQVEAIGKTNQGKIELRLIE
ncbi:MAG: hypothetical protein WA874_23330 [Chryseosolibacter sp.]